MSKAQEAFARRFEIFANEQAAEIEAVRTVLQVFVLHILSAHPSRSELFASLESTVLERLDNETTLQTPNSNERRKASLVYERASLMLEEMAPAFRASTSPNKAN
jgi:hypothetical protein